MSRSYGRLSDAQAERLRPFVEGKVVHDLGAGPDCDLSLVLISLGAKRVIAIEKDSMTPLNHPDIEQHEIHFSDYIKVHSEEQIEVAFIAAPRNARDWDLLTFVRIAKVVVYLGKNTDGTACGFRQLFESFFTREVLAYVPEYPRTLIVYGGDLKEPRQMRGEEYAALHGQDGDAPILRFEEVEGIVGAIGSIGPD